MESYMNKIANRMVFSAILWIGIAAFQILIAIPLILFGGYGLLTLGCGIWNITVCVKELKTAKIIRSCDSAYQAAEIMNYFESKKNSCWWAILINLICGGVIGVIGNIYDLCICRYALKHREEMGV